MRASRNPECFYASARRRSLLVAEAIYPQISMGPTAADTLGKLKAHLATHGFLDIEVNMSGGYDPTQTDQSSKLIQTQISTYRMLGLDPSWSPLDSVRCEVHMSINQLSGAQPCSTRTRPSPANASN